MLSFTVRDLLTDPGLQIAVEAEWDIPSIQNGSETYPCTKPWVIKGSIINVGGEVLEFVGTVDSAVEMHCARCLKPVTQPLHIDIRQRFVKEGLRSSKEYDFDYIPIENDRVDLDETIENEVQLGVPMRVLCKEDCKGLCPSCGKDLNEGPCECKEDDSDPRWDALKDLFSE